MIFHSVLIVYSDLLLLISKIIYYFINSVEIDKNIGLNSSCCSIMIWIGSLVVTMATVSLPVSVVIATGMLVPVVVATLPVSSIVVAVVVTTTVVAVASIPVTIVVSPGTVSVIVTVYALAHFNFNALADITTTSKGLACFDLNFKALADITITIEALACFNLYLHTFTPVRTTTVSIPWYTHCLGHLL